MKGDVWAKGNKGDPKEKVKGKDKWGYWGTPAWGKGCQGICYECGEKGHKAGEGLCKIQKITKGEDSAGTDCDAIEIGTVWNVCAVDTEATSEAPPQLWRRGTCKMSTGNSFGKENGGTKRFNRWEALAREEENGEENGGEIGQGLILKAPSKTV